MSVTPITNTAAATTTAATTATNGASSTNGYVANSQSSSDNGLSETDFLQILSTEMDNQDPTNPVDDTQFIGEMAQFSSLQSMQSMNQSTQLQTATAMIGKAVKAQVSGSNGTELVYGDVTSAQQTNGNIYLTLDNGQQVQSTNVQEVLGAEGILQEAQNLVGQQVYMNGQNGSTTPVEVQIAAAKPVDGDSGIGSVVLIPNGLTVPPETMANAQSLVGQQVLVEEYSNGVDTGMLKQITVTSVQTETDSNGNQHIMLMTDSNIQDAADYSTYVGTPQQMYTLENVQNVAPSAASVSTTGTTGTTSGTTGGQ